MSTCSVLCGFCSTDNRPSYHCMLEIDTDFATKITVDVYNVIQKACALVGLLKPKRSIAKFQVRGASVMA